MVIEPSSGSANSAPVLTSAISAKMAGRSAIEEDAGQCRCVCPAHTLKGDRDTRCGAARRLAEAIEHIARQCVETRDAPDQALEHVVKLRPTFEATLTMLEREANPLVERRPQFGRRAG